MPLGDVLDARESRLSARELRFHRDNDITDLRDNVPRVTAKQPFSKI